MVLTLSISDNANGTGGTATVAGSDAGSANSVYAAAVGAGAAWGLVGTRTGDGALTVNPGPGLRLFYASGTAGGSPAISPPAAQTLTQSAQSVHYRCLTAVQGIVQGLGLPGIDANDIQVTWLDANRCQGLYDLPCVSISPLGSEGQPGVLCGRDDIEYPVLVSIEDAGMNDMQLGLAGRTLWRQGIFRSFRNQPLPGVSEIVTTVTDPRPVLDPSWFMREDLRFVSALLFKFRSREPRGVGA